MARRPVQRFQVGNNNGQDETWAACVQREERTCWSIPDLCTLNLIQGVLFLVIKNFEAINEATLRGLEQVLGPPDQVDRLGSDEQLNASINAIWGREPNMHEIDELNQWQTAAIAVQQRISRYYASLHDKEEGNGTEPVSV